MLGKVISGIENSQKERGEQVVEAGSQGYEGSKAMEFLSEQEEK